MYVCIHMRACMQDKPDKSLNSILRQVFCINFSRRIQSSQFKSHSTCSFVYTCIYTISNQHFKAFTVSKFYSETTFLYQLFKANSNFIVESHATCSFMYVYLYVCMCVCIYVSQGDFQIYIFKPLQCLNSILRQLFCINFSRRIQISQFESHARCSFMYVCMYVCMYVYIYIYICFTR